MTWWPASAFSSNKRSRFSAVCPTKIGDTPPVGSTLARRANSRVISTAAIRNRSKDACSSSVITVGAPCPGLNPCGVRQTPRVMEASSSVWSVAWNRSSIPTLDSSAKSTSLSAPQHSECGTRPSSGHGFSQILHMMYPGSAAGRGAECCLGDPPTLTLGECAPPRCRDDLPDPDPDGELPACAAKPNALGGDPRW